MNTTDLEKLGTPQGVKELNKMNRKQLDYALKTATQLGNQRLRRLENSKTIDPMQSNAYRSRVRYGEDKAERFHYNKNYTDTEMRMEILAVSRFMRMKTSTVRNTSAALKSASKKWEETLGYVPDFGSDQFKEFEEYFAHLKEMHKELEYVYPERARLYGEFIKAKEGDNKDEVMLEAYEKVKEEEGTFQWNVWDGLDF